MWSNPRIPFQLADQRARLAPLNGKPLMVHVVMNIEYWPFDRQMPRGILPAPHGRPADPPDVPNFAWVEYGLRCGMPRIMAMLKQRGIRASAFMNAQVADVYPALAQVVVDAQWELVGHGWYQRSLKQSEDEAGEIRRCLERLAALDGRRPRAWLGAGMGETADTPDLLKAEGIEFLHDWLMDDLPCWMRTKHGPMLALPYTFELNDVINYAVQHSSSDEILERLRATLAIYEREIAEQEQPRIVTFGLHPHIIGVPHIAYYFEKALDTLMARSDVTFVTSSEIGEWFVEADGTMGAELSD
ncbi:MAG: polysaccharide deacetylase family protein [Hyphomicrobiaceae bacterium]